MSGDTAPSPAPVWPDGEMRAAIEALPVGTVVRLGHTFPETGNFQGSQYLRTSRGLRYIGPGRDDSDATTLHQQVQMCDDFRVDARPTSVLPDPTADTVMLGKVRALFADTDVHSAVLMQRVANVLEGDHPDAYIGQVESDRQQVRNLVGEWFDDYNVADRFLGMLDRSGFQIERKADAIAALLAGGS